jgi:tRNA wybutosine-synthesizing protein 3
MSPIYNFLNEKKKVMAELELAKKNKLIDQDVIPVLNIINSQTMFFSTSSCSGRVMVIAVAHPGSKNESEIIRKWHDKFDRADLKDAVKSWSSHKNLYFLAQPPIFHITTNYIHAAIKLRNIAESAGFKYSSIRSIKLHNKKKGTKSEENDTNFDIEKITVELKSTERLNIPLGFNGKLIIGDVYLENIATIANDVILESKEKLDRLKKVLELNFH